MGLLDEVRAHAAAVAGSARFVTIDVERIAQYAASLPLDEARAAQLDPATHYLGEPEATLAYVVTLDAINFGSGYFPHLRKRPGLSGYFTVASCLKEAWPMSVDALRRITAPDCARIFGQTEADADVQELMGLFAQALNGLGEFVASRYAGQFEHVVEEADGSAETLATALTAMPFYRDVGFYKRAQLTAADLAAAGVASFR